MKNQAQHYDGQPVISYNGIITEIITNRNFGKTWNFKKRAFVRGIKRGKKTLWLRTFKKEAKEAIKTFYTSLDLQKFCGIQLYDKETKRGNVKQIGNTFYCKRGKRWHWFLKICAISDANGCRSADDVNLDTIVYDEFTTTAEQMRRFHGNVVDYFFDIFFSMKREHEVRAFLLGNKENVLNPFLTYFNVKPLPSTFEGIKTYREGSLIIQQINNLPAENSVYDKKLKALLKNTSYGNYIYDAEYKNEKRLKTAKPPANASEYIQLNINGFELKVWCCGGNYYVTNKIDTKRRVYVLEMLNKYKLENVLIKRQKRYFVAFENAIADNRVFYQNRVAYEAIQPFYKWLTI